MTSWTEVCALDAIEEEGVRRLGNQGRTVADSRMAGDEVFCTDGLCSHEAVHLGNGLVTDYEIECPKHSGVFDIRKGEAMRVPACANLRTYPARVDSGRVLIGIWKAYKQSSDSDDLSIGWAFAHVVASREVRIHFLGLWDTVGSIIAPLRDRIGFGLTHLPDTSRNPSVAIVRHVLAIEARENVPPRTLGYGRVCPQ